MGSTCISPSGRCSRRPVSSYEPHTQHKHEPRNGNVPAKQPSERGSCGTRRRVDEADERPPASLDAGDADLDAFAELRPASGPPGSATLRDEDLEDFEGLRPASGHPAFPALRSPHTDPNLHMSCLVCHNELEAGGNSTAYYCCRGSSAGHGHSTRYACRVFLPQSQAHRMPSAHGSSRTSRDDWGARRGLCVEIWRWLVCACNAIRRV